MYVNINWPVVLLLLTVAVCTESRPIRTARTICPTHLTDSFPAILLSLEVKHVNRQIIYRDHSRCKSNNLTSSASWKQNSCTIVVLAISECKICQDGAHHRYNSAKSSHEKKHRQSSSFNLDMQLCQCLNHALALCNILYWLHRLHSVSHPQLTLIFPAQKDVLVLIILMFVFHWIWTSNYTRVVTRCWHI